ncbi:MAG: hypothetical protein NC416_08085 [Eubacterium sp.]|nr:hypothetical protein [Eubacterium sp.]
MMIGSGFKKYENYILTFVIMALNIAVMGICFDFYYDLNDDTMMKDIMSGVYSGMPDGHNMQTLYPLGALIALGYRLCRTIPWYGLFLCLCQFGCLYLIGVRLCVLAERSGAQTDVMRGKIVSLLFLSLFLWGVCLPHLVNIQYTITCTILSATAVFLFTTTPKEIDTQQFVVKNIPAVILVIAAYQLRTEMLLLTFPFICLAGLYRVAEEKEIFAKENLWKYGAVIGMILAGMILSSIADYAAYGSADWKEFRDFFDARTTVYDFYPELVTHEEYRDALTGLGVTVEQQKLLSNYNFGLDDAIDARTLGNLAEYASSTLGKTKDWAAIGREKMSYYFYRTFHSQDAPYNLLVLWLYVAVMLASVLICPKHEATEEGEGKEKGAQAPTRRKLRRYDFVWQLILLVAVRSAVWLFILMRGRDPVRITHSLYLVEAALLSAMLARRYYAYDDVCASDKKAIGIARGMAVLLILFLSVSMTDHIGQVRDDQNWRKKVNEEWYAIDDYCRERTENFYFEDVYSTVSFSQKIFADTDNSYANYDIMGGWMCKSPLYFEKLSRYGIVSAGESLLKQDNVYLIVSDMEASEQGFGWLADFYGAQGIDITVEEVERIGEHYSVYQVCGQ